MINHKMTRKLFLLSALLLFSLMLSNCSPEAYSGNADNGSVSFSNGKVKKYILCVKYKTHYQVGWKDQDRMWKANNVEVYMMNGNTLNQKRKTSKFASNSTYAVIYWSQEQANIPNISQDEVSVIELNNFFTGRFGSYTHVTGYDQMGNKWGLTRPQNCY